MKKTVSLALLACLVLAYQNCAKNSITPVASKPVLSEKQEVVEPEPVEREEIAPIEPFTPEPLSVQPDPPKTPKFSSSNIASVEIDDRLYGKLSFIMKGDEPGEFSIGQAPCLQRLELKEELRSAVDEIVMKLVNSGSSDYVKWFNDLNLLQNQVRIVVKFRDGTMETTRIPYDLLPSGYPENDHAALLLTTECMGEENGEMHDISKELKEYAINYYKGFSTRVLDTIDDVMP